MAWWPSLVDPRSHLPGGVTTLPNREVASHSLPPRHTSWLLVEAVDRPSSAFASPHTSSLIFPTPRDSPPVVEAEDEAHYHSQFLWTPPLDIRVHRCFQGCLRWSTRYLPMPVRSQNMVTAAIARHASPFSYAGRPPTQVVNHRPPVQRCWHTVRLLSFLSLVQFLV